jgi:hypothetical protein
MQFLFLNPDKLELNGIKLKGVSRKAAKDAKKIFKSWF